MYRRNVIALAALAATVWAGPGALAQSKDIRIAIIASKTGPLEAYAKQTIVGFNMGLDYATGGSMMVAGKKLVVLEKDDQGKPDVGKSLLAAAYADDKVDIAVGPTASPVALAMLPVAEEYKKILLVEPAVADSITGDKWNKYIFRTGRNSSQDAASNAAAMDAPGNVIAILANDNAFGRDGVKATKEFTKKAKIVHEEYLPVGTSDFTAGLQRIVDKLKDQPGKKYIAVAWSGAPTPFGKIADLDLKKRYGIDLKQVPMVADTLRDLQAAAAAGCEPHLVLSGRAACLGPDEVQHILDQVSGARVHDDLPAFAEHLITRNAAHTERH